MVKSTRRRFQDSFPLEGALDKAKGAVTRLTIGGLVAAAEAEHARHLLALPADSAITRTRAPKRRPNMSMTPGRPTGA